MALLRNIDNGCFVSLDIVASEKKWLNWIILVCVPLDEMGDTIALVSGLSTNTQILLLIKFRDIPPTKKKKMKIIVKYSNIQKLT